MIINSNVTRTILCGCNGFSLIFSSLGKRLFEMMCCELKMVFFWALNVFKLWKFFIFKISWEIKIFQHQNSIENFWKILLIICITLKAFVTMVWEPFSIINFKKYTQCNFPPKIEDNSWKFVVCLKTILWDRNRNFW